MEFQQLLSERRSVRAFTGAPVSAEQRQILLEAAIRAPSACNLQSWHFYVVADRAKIEALYPTVYGAAWIQKAGLVVIVCTDADAITHRFGEKGSSLFCLQDTAAAMENLLLCAADLGLGGCWIGAFDPEACRVFAAIPDSRTPVAIAAIGEIAEKSPLRERRPLDEVVTVIGKETQPAHAQVAAGYDCVDRR